MFRGFSRYFVDQRNGLEAYKKIVKEYREHGKIMIVDDNKQVLDDLIAHTNRLQDNVHIVHVHTSARHCNCEVGYDDLYQVLEMWKRRGLVE